MRLLLVLLWCLLAVAFDANATADGTANGVTSINTSNLTVGSGSNRALVVQVSWSGTVTSPALKWDNAGTPQSLTAVPSATATNTVLSQIWGLVAPTSGVKQLNAAWTTARDVVLNGVSYTGVDQTGGATSFPHGAGTTGTSAAGTNAGQAAITITSASGNAAVSVSTSAGGGFTVPNQTQTFIDATPASMSSGGQRASGAATVTFSWTMINASAWASAGCDLAAGGAVSTATGIYPDSSRPFPFKPGSPTVRGF